MCSLKEQKCIIFLVNYRCGNFTKLPCETYYKLDIWVSKFSHHNSISLSICLLLYIVSSSYLFIIQMKSEIDFVFYIYPLKENWNIWFESFGYGLWEIWRRKTCFTHQRNLKSCGKYFLDVYIYIYIVGIVLFIYLYKNCREYIRNVNIVDVCFFIFKKGVRLEFFCYMILSTDSRCLFLFSYISLWISISIINI